MIKRKEFEESLLRGDVVNYYLSKTQDDLEVEFGVEVSRMVGFEQKSPHHCYDLWIHTLKTVEGIKSKGLSDDQIIKLRVAAFFHDIGKPDVAKFNEKTGSQVFYGHALKSMDISKDILRSIGYEEKEIKQICFLVEHHDDFISYKKKIEPQMQNHEYIREINTNTVSEIIFENMYDFESMGYDKDQIRVICYTLAHGEKPNFNNAKGPIDIQVNMDEVNSKIKEGKFRKEYVPLLENYGMLIRLCKADANAQSEIAINNDGKKVGSKEDKINNISAIQECMQQSYSKANEIVQKITKRDVGDDFGDK